MEGSDKKTRLGSGPPPSGGPVAGTPPVSAYDPTPRAPFDAPMPVRQSQPLPANVPAAGRAPAPPPADPLIGTLLAGRYQVDNKLGEGGMGSVYLATHVALEKRVALKVLHNEFARKPDLVERFLLEAKAASRIRHENVIDISDFGSTPDGTVFFAMEFLEGKDLHDLIARAKLTGQPVSWKRARDIFLQVCAALSAAHAKGIVHRDLKPENIFLVDRAGMADFVKLLDFGIAKVTEVSDEEGRKLTRTGMLFGTPEYMSPEQARGERADHRVDVYAMGCILHQLITGEVPFQADNFMGILSLHLTEPPPPVTPEQLAGAGAPPGLAAVIARALAKNRDDRYLSMDQMARALVDAEKGRGAGPLAAPPPAEAAPQRAGGKGVWIAVALLLIAGAVVAFVLTRGGGSSEEGTAKPPNTPNQIEDQGVAPPVAPSPDSVVVPSSDQRPLATPTDVKPTPAGTTAKTPKTPKAPTPKDPPPAPPPTDPLDPTIGDVETKDPFNP